MNIESLKIVRNAILETISELEIDITDRVELMKNIYNFLDNKDYDDNIKTLAKRKYRRQQNERLEGVQRNGKTNRWKPYSIHRKK